MTPIDLPTLLRRLELVPVRSGLGPQLRALAGVRLGREVGCVGGLVVAVGEGVEGGLLGGGHGVPPRFRRDFLSPPERATRASAIRT